MKPRPGLDAAIAAAVGIAAGLALLWSSMPGSPGIDCYPRSSGSTPLGAPPVDFGIPAETVAGSQHWYNFSVFGGSGVLHLRNIDLQVQTPGGSSVAPGPEWSMTMFNLSRGWVGTFALTGTAGGTWTAGGDSLLAGGQTLSLLTTPQGVSGDSLVVSLSGNLTNGCPAAGSEAITIP